MYASCCSLSSNREFASISTRYDLLTNNWEPFLQETTCFYLPYTYSSLRQDYLFFLNSELFIFEATKWLTYCWHTSVLLSVKKISLLLLSCPFRHCVLASATQYTLLQFKTRNIRLFPKRESPYFSQMLQLSVESFQSHTEEALWKLFTKGEAVFSFGVAVRRCCLVIGSVPWACLKHCVWKSCFKTYFVSDSWELKTIWQHLVP